MKKLSAIFGTALLMFFAVGANDVQAHVQNEASLKSTTTPKKKANVGQLVSGLINVNIGAIQTAIEVGDITVQDLVDVENVLNDNEINILNNVLSNNTITIENVEILNNLLRDANILNDSQTVVGVLSGQLVFQKK